MKAPSEKTLLHMGDTELFSDMALLNEIYQPKIGIIPIGNRGAMGAELAAMAGKRYYDFETVIPCHYGTFDLLDPDVDKFVEEMKGAVSKVLVPERGQAFELQSLFAVVLDAGGPQAGEAVAVDRLLPGKEFLYCQRVAGTSLLKTEEPAANGSDNLGLPSYDPSLGVARWEIGNRQRTTIWPDYVFNARTHLLGHSTLTLALTQCSGE